MDVALQILGIVAFAGSVAAVIFKAGRWSRDRESVGSAITKAKKNGNGDSVGHLFDRMAGIEETVKDTNEKLGMLSTDLRVQQAERTILMADNARQHEEFRSLFSAINRRIDNWQMDDK